MNARIWMSGPISLTLVMATTQSFAVTLSDITSSLSDNAEAVDDLTADVVVDSSDNTFDVLDAEFQLKRMTTPYNKFRIEETAGGVRCDGAEVASGPNLSQFSTWCTAADSFIGWISMSTRDTDILWLIDNNTFTLATGTFTINSITCRKIESAGYTIYVNDSNHAKVVRIDALSNNTVDRRYDFDGYSYIESEAYIPDTVNASRPNLASEPTYEITYSNININENLSDSLFDIP
ncbi:MAG: hypothetical protein AAF333_01010 [Planctomycetota bacterium]